MIKANELRIGNWVKVKDKFVKVESLDDSGINLDISYGEYGGIDYDGRLEAASIFSFEEFAEPIPITPEILEKCGFEKIKDKYRIINNFIKYDFYIKEKYSSDNPNCGIFGVAYDEDEYEINENGDKVEAHNSWTGFAWGVKYLHRLQNIYHSVTGQELEINL